MTNYRLKVPTTTETKVMPQRKKDEKRSRRKALLERIEKQRMTAYIKLKKQFKG